MGPGQEERKCLKWKYVSTISKLQEIVEISESDTLEDTLAIW